MTIAQAGRALRTWQVSCAELVEAALEAARAESHLNAFLTITADQARREARFLDNELRKGRDRGPLHGIPVAYKDLIYTRDVRTTNGSRIFAGFTPHYDATVVTRMESAGAISIGKLNQHELAYGITSSNPHYGPVRNPWDPECIPGGSSGGSGAAVAKGIVFCGMGSDTGGSIRCPASYCGVVGLKPTFGRVSRYGCFPLGLTLDHIGPLTRTAADAALILNAIAGPDPKDESAVARSAEVFDVPKEPSIVGLRLGVPVHFFNERLHPEVAAAFDRTLGRAEAAGARTVELRMPDPEALNLIARTILLAEAAAVMAPHLHRRDEFGSDVLSLLDQGRLLPATDYINAQRVRRQMVRDWQRLFRSIDFLLTPTTPIPAPRIGQSTVPIGGTEEDTRLASTRFLRGVNLLGFPAISIPNGRTADGLPLGLQIIGPPWSEKRLLACAAALEQDAPA